MKKFMMAGVLALGVALLAQQPASAWSKWNFSVGLNFSYEGANNSYLWGAVRGGQVPGYPTDVGHGFYNQGGGTVYDQGYYGQGDAHGYAPSYPAQQFQAPLPQQAPETKKEETKTSWYGNPNYQPAVYYYQTPAHHTPTQHYYQANPYSYQSYGYPQGYGPSYSGRQVPSYWYGY